MFFKKVLSFIILLGLIATLVMAPMGISAENNEADIDMGNELVFMPGDINGDGKINSGDLITIARVQAKWKNIKYAKSTLDTNGDGEFNLKDVVRLSQKLAGWNVEISNVPFRGNLG